MKCNKNILKIFKQTNEKFLEDYYIREINDSFIEAATIRIEEFESSVKKDNFKVIEFDSFLKKKVDGKKVMSYSYFSKWLNIVNLSLKLVELMPQKEKQELISLYKSHIKNNVSQATNLNKFLVKSLLFSKSSQSKGHTFKNKLRDQFEKNNYKEVEKVSELIKHTYTLRDSTIMEYIYKNNIKFEWSIKHVKKKPDFLFIDKEGNVFIGEHKNLKESGGAQDKQINELITFIAYDESRLKVYYVSYCDGPYFNNISEIDLLQNNKLSNQLADIESNIKDTKNYFVNTEAFELLISENE